METNNNSLYHFGVKGMKWGRRKAKTASSGTNKKVKKTSEKWTTKDKVKAGAIIAGSVLAAVGGYKVGKAIRTYADAGIKAIAIDAAKRYKDNPFSATGATPIQKFAVKTYANAIRKGRGW